MAETPVPLDVPPRDGRSHGRPLRLPGDEPSPTGPAAHVSRLAWLLITKRLSSSNNDLVSRSRFVDRLRTDGIAADVTRVSRWESGRQLAPGRALAAYERLLGLPPASLVVLSRNLTRNHGTPTGRNLVSVLDLQHSAAPDAVRTSDAEPDPPGGMRQAVTITERAPDPARELEGLIGTVVGHGDLEDPALSGNDWVRLAERLAEYDAVFLDHRSWSVLCGRLVNELIRGVASEMGARFEAAATLIAHPAAGPHLLAAIAEAVEHPHAQRVAPPVVLLAHCSLGSSEELLFRWLTEYAPTHPLPDIAASAAAIKLVRGGLSADMVTRVEGHLSARLADRRPRVSLLDLTLQLPRGSFHRTLDAVPDLGLRRRLTEMRKDPLVVAGPVARRVARTVTHSIREAVAGPMNLVPDPLLERMVVETLFHVSIGVRWTTGNLLGMSPYAAPLVASCLDLARGSDKAVAHNAWIAIATTSAARAHTPGLAAAVLAERRRGTRTVALKALSRSGAHLCEAEVEQVVQSALGDASVATRLEAVGVLARHAPDRLPDALGTDDRIDGAVAWWQAIGPPIS